MRSSPRRLFVIVAAIALLMTALPAGAGHEEDPITKNLHKMGHIEEPASLLTGVGGGNIHTDIAFWGKYAFQGSWLGFNIRDISAPGNPKHVSFTSCTGNQGDVVVWDNILVRSWNSPAGSTATCDGSPVAMGFEGLHVFDISNLNDPVLVSSVDLSAAAVGGCGSHTATGIPDPANNQLLIYNSGSGCQNFEIVSVPLDNPAGAAYLKTINAGRACHDIGVILGDANLAACSGGNGFSTFDISDLENPVMLDSVVVPDVGIGHTAAFTWDGETMIFGHEPGGGVFANCQAINPDSDKSLYFYDITTVPASLEGTWVMPRPQSDIENCTVHNLNVVPLTNGRDVLVQGSYQSGTSVVDFTDRSNPVELAYTDPPPIPPPGGPFCGGLGCEIGGAWSSYWYNNFIYETNITEGLNVFRFSGKQTAGALKLDHLNPQTQMFTID